MQIDTIENFGEALLFHKYYFRKIDFANSNIGNLLRYTKRDDYGLIKQNLNIINNQEIQDIDIGRGEYRHRNNWLYFSSLSKAERVFLIATVADLQQVKIWLHTDMTQLTKTTTKKFLKLFKNSPYINIVIDSELNRAFYNAMIKEVSALD